MTAREIEMGYWKFWRFHYRPPTWTEKRFGIEYQPDMISGVLYAGVTLFGHSIVYSSHW